MWYVIWTATGKEEELRNEIVKSVSQELYSKCWVPCRMERRKESGRWLDVKKVLFPGYLFIETNDIEAIYIELRHIVYFSKILKTGDCYTPVNAKEEQLIRRLTGEGDIVTISSGIIENDKVIIHSGPLKGMEGFIKKIDRHKRKAYLKIEMFNRMVETCVGLEIVEKTE